MTKVRIYVRKFQNVNRPFVLKLNSSEPYAILWLMDGPMDDARKGRFLWGAALAWIPFLALMLPPIVAAFTGGRFEAFLAALLLSEIWAIALLVRTFSRQHPIRAAFTALSLCCSGYVVFVSGTPLWLFLFWKQH